VRIKWLLFALLFSALSVGTLHAANHAAATCNTSDVQTAINAAAEGDTVTIPAGTCTWTSGVTISGKGITVTGAGSGRIIAYSSDTLTIGIGSKTINVSDASVSNPLVITNGETLRISETGNRQNYMTGTVSSYSSGSLVMNITSTGGSCGNSSSSISPSNCKRWLISTPPTTTVVNNSSSALFSVTEDTSIHTNLSGFKIAEGTGTGDGLDFDANTNGQAILLHDCWIEQSTSGDSVHFSTNRGVIWNCSFDATPFSMAPLAIHLQPFDTTAWSLPSYMGTSDPDGQHNIYVEDSDFHAYLNATDNDEGARSVFRYSFFDNAGFGTHGADTSPLGQRYFEYYNNVGLFNRYTDGTTFDMTWWHYIRGGTFVIYNNTTTCTSGNDYPCPGINMTVMNLQRNTSPAPTSCWGSGYTTSGEYYYAPHQVGLGNVTGKGTANFPPDGVTNASTYNPGGGYPVQYVGDPDPGYIWGNTPALNSYTSDYGGNGCANPDKSSNYILAGRDYFNNGTAKPGYAPYTYPHPLRNGSGGGGGGGGNNPNPPTGLAAVVH
jgi:hypothetical protein